MSENDTYLNAFKSAVYCRFYLIKNKYFRADADAKNSMIVDMLASIHNIYFDTAIEFTIQSLLDTPFVMLCTDGTGQDVVHINITSYRLFDILTLYAQKVGLSDIWPYHVFAMASPSIYYKAYKQGWIPTFPGTAALYFCGASEVDFISAVGHNAYYVCAKECDASFQEYISHSVGGNIVLTENYNRALREQDLPEMLVYDEDEPEQTEPEQTEPEQTEQHVDDEQEYAEQHADDPDA